jgi:methylmalonyl-CoA mutase
MPKQRIEEAAARRQARIERGADVIVGVNKFQGNQPMPEIRQIDNTEVRRQQMARLEQIKATRDNGAVEAALEAVTKVAANGGNLLPVCIDAMRVRATLGEVSGAMEKVFGRYQAHTTGITGVYSTEFAHDEQYARVHAAVEQFEHDEGRRPRVYMAKMGQDGHDRGAHVVASGLSDLGFTVDIGPLFETPAQVAQNAIDNDVHVVGVSSQAAGHKTLVPELINELASRGRSDIGVVVGGVIPETDYQFLYDHGVKAIFGPMTPIVGAGEQVLHIAKGEPATGVGRSNGDGVAR